MHYPLMYEHGDDYLVHCDISRNHSMKMFFRNFFLLFDTSLGDWVYYISALTLESLNGQNIMTSVYIVNENRVILFIFYIAALYCTKNYISELLKKTSTVISRHLQC